MNVGTKYKTDFQICECLRQQNLILNIDLYLKKLPLAIEVTIPVSCGHVIDFCKRKLAKLPFW